MSATTTIAVEPAVLKLVEQIAKKRSEQLGFEISKGAVIKNIVLAEARALGIVPETPVQDRRSPVRRGDPAKPRRGER